MFLWTSYKSQKESLIASMAEVKSGILRVLACLDIYIYIYICESKCAISCISTTLFHIKETYCKNGEKGGHPVGHPPGVGSSTIQSKLGKCSLLPIMYL